MRRIRRALLGWISRLVGRMRHDRLSRAMRAPLRRRIALWAMFRAMPRAVRRRALERERLVVEWQLTGRPDGRHDVRQLVIEDGRAAVLEGQAREPDLTLVMEAVDLLLLATGNASAPVLFVSGRLTIEGDPYLAMRLPRIFARAR